MSAAAAGLCFGLYLFGIGQAYQSARRHQWSKWESFTTACVWPILVISWATDETISDIEQHNRTVGSGHSNEHEHKYNHNKEQ